MNESSHRPIEPPAEIAFIGLGNMGQPMAARLIGAGYRVSGFDNTPSVRERFAETSGTAAGSLEAAVSPNDRLATLWHPWVTYLIVPLFALANAGVELSALVRCNPGVADAPARKHRIKPEQLPDLIEQSRQRLAQLDVGLSPEALQEKEAQARDTYFGAARSLSGERSRASRELSEGVTAAMQTLAMAGGRFEVQLVAGEGTAHGLEGVRAEAGVAVEDLPAGRVGERQVQEAGQAGQVGDQAGRQGPHRLPAALPGHLPRHHRVLCRVRLQVVSLVQRLDPRDRPDPARGVLRDEDVADEGLAVSGRLEREVKA